MQTQIKKEKALKQSLIFFILLLSLSSESHAEKMRVAYASFGPALSPSWVTAEKGFWKKHGLDVELIYLGGGSRSVPALLSGSIEVFLGSDTAGYTANLQGADLVKLGVAMNTTGYSVVTRPEIGTVADLKGKTLGIGRGRDLPYIHLSKLLRDNGFDPRDDVKWLALGGSDAGRLAMLKSGVIHGTVFPATADLIAVRAGMKILQKLETPALAGGIHSSSIFVQKNRDSLRRFLEGYIEGIHYMINHRDESVMVFSKVLKNSDLNSVAHLYDEIGKRVQQDLRPNPESVRFFIDLIAVDYPQAQRLSEKDYWDLSLLDEIQRSGFVQRLYRK